MAQVDILVNDRAYKVTCDDGQEPRLHRLAADFDAKVRELARELGQVGDARLMLLAALTVCDELAETRILLADHEAADEALDAQTAGGAARVMTAAAKRVEGLAKRLVET